MLRSGGWFLQTARDGGRLFPHLQDLSRAIIHTDGEGCAGTAGFIMSGDTVRHVIARRAGAPAIVVIVISTAFLSASFISSTCGANDASIRLKGTGWSRLRQDG
jgi:hypothetical protein